MSMALSASTSMISKMLQSFGSEELTIVVVTFLVAVAFHGAVGVAFRGARLGKQTGASKSHLAEKTGSSKSPELLKLKQADVTLTQNVTHEERQSSLQGACGEELAQNSQQMSPTVSGGSGVEPAKESSHQRWKHQRKLRQNGSIVSSGDPVKDALVKTIRSSQSSCKEVWHKWSTFCVGQECNNRDPARYPVDVLQQFVQDHCYSEECSSQFGSTRKQLHPSTPAQALAPCHFLSRKVELLIDCARRHEDAIAIAILEEIRSTGENTAFADALKCGKHTVEAFSVLVQFAGRIGRIELIEVLFGVMTSTGIKRSMAFYHSTMKMLASKKLYKEGMYVYSCLQADCLAPSPGMLSCLISFAGELGDSERAISFFNRLAACSIPSVGDCKSILLVHSRDQNWPKSLALLRYMQDGHFPVDSLLLNLVLSTGVAAGESEAATALLQEFSTTGSADVISYNTVMKGFCQQKYGGQAIELLDKMCQVGVKPNAVTFNIAMDVAVRSLRVEDAWQMLARMVEAGLAPDKYTFTVLTKGLHCGATSEQLAVILDLMPTGTQDCDPISCAKMFRSVIEAVAQVNDPDLAASAIAQMIDQRVMLPPQDYQLMLQVLSFDKEGNRMEQSRQILMELHDIGKCTPCAFVYDKKGCRLGPTCPRCHMCSPEELSKASNAKAAFQKARLTKARKDIRWQIRYGCLPSELQKSNSVQLRRGESHAS